MNCIENNKDTINYIDIDFDTTCRFCGDILVNKKYLVLKNNSYILQKIYKTLRIEIVIENVNESIYPGQICEICWDTIEMFCEFQEKCYNYENFWKKIVENKEIIQHTSNFDCIELNSENIIEVPELSENNCREVSETLSSNDIENFAQHTEVELLDQNIEWIEDDVENEINPDEFILQPIDLDEISSIPKISKAQDIDPKSNEQDFCVNRNGFVYKTNSYKYIKECENGFECCFCLAIFKWKFKAELHVRKHTKETPFICEFCGKSYAAMHYLNKHKTQIHVGRKYICKFCGKKFARRYVLKEHEVTHRGSPTISCLYCDKMFHVETKLKIHIANFHASRSHMCDICGKTFKTKARIQHHMLRHVNEKKFECQKCSKKYITQRDLFIHERKHFMKYQYTCADCDISFQTKKGLMAHLRICPKIMLVNSYG